VSVHRSFVAAFARVAGASRAGPRAAERVWAMRAPRHRFGAMALAGILSAGSATAGCDTSRFTAQQSMGLVTRGSAAIQEHWDIDLVGAGMPASLLQLEGLYATLPDDGTVGYELLRAYVSYAYGWVEDEAERAEEAGDLDAQTAALARSRWLYVRARNIGLHHLRQRDPGLEAALHGPAAALEEHLGAHFRSRDDVPLLLWTAQAWGLAVRTAPDDPELVSDLATVRMLVERAVALDETVANHGGLSFLASMAAAVPEGMGGQPEVGRALFERALAATGRGFFAIQLQYATTYAVTVGDRDLYIRLLREVIDGGDPRPDVRLANRIARRRAIRALRRVDAFF